MALSADDRVPAESYQAKFLGDISVDSFRGFALLAAGRRQARPGQYLHIRMPAEGGGARLQCAIPIAGCLHSGDTDQTLFELPAPADAEFAAALAARGIDSEVLVTGPLGRGFRVDPARPNAVLVAGEQALGPMLFLTQRLAAAGLPEPALIAGPETGDRAAGRLREHLSEDEPDPAETIVYAAGCDELLAAVIEVAERYGVPCQVLPVRPMPCTDRSCGLCLVGGKSGPLAACLQGPVFDAADLARPVPPATSA